MFDFGLRIQELRQQHNMSQEQLGRRDNRSKSVISSYENNVKIPPLDVLTQMAIVFHVSLDYLVGIDKQDMVSIDGLSHQQKKIIHSILIEFEDQSRRPDGLSDRQQEILNLLMKEFAKQNSLGR